MRETQSLYEWDADVSQLAQMREALRRRPQYASAVQRLAGNLLRDADEDPSLGGLVRDAGRTVAALSAMSLDASGGVTLPRLKVMIAGFGLVSPGRARLLLRYMQHLGYLEPDPRCPTARPMLYRVTQRFRTSYMRHQASVLDAVSILEPAAGRVRDGLATPGVMAALVAAQAEAFIAGSRQTTPFDLWYRVFMHRLAGIQILHGLVAQAETFPPRGKIPFSAAETARRFKVSRVHVARMMREAEHQDFLVLEPGAVRFTEAGREALDWLYASRLCVHLACAARALKALS